MRACVWMVIALAVFTYGLGGQEPSSRNPYIPPPMVKKSVLVAPSDGLRGVPGALSGSKASGSPARRNPYLPTPLLNPAVETIEAPTSARRDWPFGAVPQAPGPAVSEPDAPFARPLGRTVQPVAAPLQPSGAESQKREAIQQLLGEVAELHPGDYSAQEKLLEVLQLERLVGVRNQALEAFRRAPRALASAGGTPESVANEAVALSTSIWTTREIPVSWDVDAATFDRYARERELVKQAVELTWQQESAIQFTGWGMSTNSSRGIRIGIRDAGPHCKRLGRYLDGMPEGMVLNFTFDNWCPACMVNQENSIQYIAVHEFGHALGLAHEQNRPDAPQWCQEKRQGTDGDWNVTLYDPQSIMNYCNPRWNNDGRLSTQDIRAIRIMYGNPGARSEVTSAGTSDAPFAHPLQGAAQGPMSSAEPLPPQGGTRMDASGRAAEVPHHVSQGAQRPQPSGATGGGSRPAVDTQGRSAPQAPRQAVDQPAAARGNQSQRIVLVMASTSVMPGDPKADMNRIEEIVRLGSAATGLNYSQPVIRGGVQNKQELLRRLEAGPGDLAQSTLVCYVKLHGVIENGEHLMEFDGSPERLTRDELRKHLLRQGARLTVILTESCTASNRPSPIVVVGAEGFPTELFSSLFVTPSDVVEINSSTYQAADGTILDQLAWMDGLGNAAFTGALAECFALRGPPQVEMLNAVRRDGQITWNSFLPHLRERTDASYQVIKNNFMRSYEAWGRPRRLGSLFDDLDKQANQYPFAYSLGN